MANVLIVDDDPGVLRALGRIIKREGYTVFESSGGVEALEVLGERNIDLAIVDLNMPDMNGIALMRWMRKAYSGVKLVPMSAVGDLLTAPSEFIAEASLTKPFTVEDVQAVLGQAFDLRLL